MPTVATNGVDTFYERTGAGPPIVFLHGGGIDHRVWAELTRPLTDRVTVIVYDLRGHGWTGGSEHERYTIELYAEDLAALIDALELNAPII